MPCNAPPKSRRTNCPSPDLADIPQGDLARIVADYRENHRRNLQKLLDHYTALDSLTTAIGEAGQGKDDRGKRHGHQRRLTRKALDPFTKGLHQKINEIRSVPNFEALYKIISEVAAPINGIGPLMVYDTALRIGARCGIYPTRVYLHAGVRKGAKALGLTTPENVLSRKAFPKPLSGLEPYEIEDCLCVFKDNF